MSLGDKISRTETKTDIRGGYIYIEDVKEFIKRIKERLKEVFELQDMGMIKDIINKEAGEKLT